MMDRRTFIGALTGCLSSARSVATAQPSGKHIVIGVLSLPSPEVAQPLHKTFEEGLRELGYVEGRNFAFERRYAGGSLDKLAQLATELVGLRVDLIVVTSNLEIAAAKRATSTLPIVMVGANDPVGAGLIASLARPGGNITGLSAVPGTAMRGKRLELLKEIIPRLSRVAVLREVGSGSAELYADLDMAARKLGVALDVVEVRSLDEFENAFATIASRRPEALYIDGASLAYVRRQQIADFALAHRLPATYGLRAYAQAGLLITYGLNLSENYRRAATFVDKIVRGTHPRDLPVEQPSKFELVINLKTAKAIGITIPQSLLLRADEILD
jgi:putative ABC transport system substrate-binding protein